MRGKPGGKEKNVGDFKEKWLIRGSQKTERIKARIQRKASKRCWQKL